MKRCMTLVAAMGCMGLVLAAGMAASTEPTTATAPAAKTIYDADFTKDLGNWKIAGGEGKQVAGEGVKFTDLKTVGGLHQEGKAVDLSATPEVTIQMENAGAEKIELHFKVKSGKQAVTKDFKVAPGKYTFKWDISESTDVEVKKIDYMKLFGQGEVNLVVKKITLSK